MIIVRQSVVKRFFSSFQRFPIKLLDTEIVSFIEMLVVINY